MSEPMSSSTVRTPSATNSRRRSRALRRLRSRANVRSRKVLGTERVAGIPLAKPEVLPLQDERTLMRAKFLAVFMAASVVGCGVSTQQEIEIGQSNVQQINQQLPIIQDAEANRYINVLGDSIARLTDRPDLPWTFYIVNSPEINAFAVPGGFIYVNRGLIEKAQTMSQLAGVLGHEIGHVVKRHSVKQMGQMNAANIGVGLACVLTSVCNSQVAQVGINAAGSAIFAKFSRDDEKEA